ncbi:uncharacterized protein LOC107868958 [Capsicum annuum]|uniref:uncharacterized protein LOC107868958 n=1 Tax=Capsicum annuum TaxID=4072 RepID=UPI001FB0D62E|nr:uncharacterized protein LOC107868958 [Capsicum annuum]
MALMEEYISVVIKKMPKKLKDLENFTLPIQIGDSEIVYVFSNLRTSKNLMPLTMFNTLGLGESRPCSLMIQLEDMTIDKPKGIIKDVLIKVGKFLLPADFIVLDYDVDNRVPIILVHPFLSMEGALINIREGTLTMRLNDEKVVFKVYKSLNLPSHYKYFCKITVMEVDKYGVVESASLKTSSDSFIELLEPPPKTEVMMIDKHKNAIVEKDIDLQSTHLRDQK